MPFDLVISYPWWYVLLCLMLGAVYAFAFYFRTRFFDKGWRWLFLTLRFLVVTILALLLLRPLLKSVTTEEEKPIVAFIQDNSLSLVAHKDSQFIRTDYLEQRTAMLNEWSKSYKVELLNLGKTLKRDSGKTNFKEKETKLSDVIPYINKAYEGRNLSAVVLATDGIATVGRNPNEQRVQASVSIYTLGMGDTARYKDQVLKALDYNEIAFLGDEFPIRISINAHFLRGVKSKVEVFEQGKLRWSKDLEYAEEEDFIETTAYLPASSPGRKKYKVVISPLEGERSLENNTKYAFLEVLDARKKVLLLYGGPHPDVACLRNAIKGNKNYQFEAKSYQDRLDLSQVDLLIAHNLPNDQRSTVLMDEARRNKLSTWIFVGTNGPLNNMNQSDYGCSIRGYRGSSSYQAYVEASFDAFHLPEGMSQSMADWPPIDGLYASTQVAPQAETVLKQKIGTVNTSNPLMTLLKTQEGNYGLFLGTGIYKWRMIEYAKKKDFEVFDDWVQKVVQYLATHKDKRKFRVAMDKLEFKQDEPVRFRAITLNANYEEEQKKEVSMIIKSDEGKEYPYYFSKAGSGYELNAGLLPVGNYSYLAKTSDGQQFGGSFVVKPALAEYNVLRANHDLLRELAETNEGKFYQLNQIKELENELKKQAFPSTLHQENQFDELINKPWILILLLLLLVGEWLLRRREGTY